MHISRNTKGRLIPDCPSHELVPFQTHRVRTVYDQPLQKDAGDLLLHHLRLRLGEQVQQYTAEVVRVLVGVAQLIRHCVEEEIPPLGVQLVRQLF